MGFNRSKMEDQRRQVAEKEAAAIDRIRINATFRFSPALHVALTADI
jgi:hypothetical protein